jgi:hypothetical protein
MAEKYEIPTILYEAPRNGKDSASRFPYIESSKTKPMPPVLFIFEYLDTGETEPGSSGEECAIIDAIPHKFLDMELLKEKLPSEINDMIRVAVGMKPLKEAQEKGQQILNKVFGNISAEQQQEEKEKN